MDEGVSLPGGRSSTLLYISMLSEEGSVEHGVCATSTVDGGGNDGNWLAARLEEAGISNKFDLTILNIAAGDELPDAELYDFVVLGGTFHNVYDARPWQKSLRPWLVEQRKTGRPLLGICGGHQVMSVVQEEEGEEGGADGQAAAASPICSKRPAGPALGSIPVTFTDEGAAHPLLQGLAELPQPSSFNFANGDEVCRVPSGATVLARTEDSPAVALDYGNGGWVSTQFHPEVSWLTFQHLADNSIISQPPPAVAYHERATTAGRTLLANFLRQGTA